MSKEDNDNSADDYLAQLEWQRTHRRRSSVYYEPKWKYKIVDEKWASLLGEARCQC